MSTVDTHQQLEALLDLAEQVGLSVRRLAGSAAGAEHPGGALVRLRGREVLFLDNSAAAADQLAVVAAALAGRPEVEGRFLPPRLREVLDAHAGPGGGRA